jgi:hypothetical protein
MKKSFFARLILVCMLAMIGIGFIAMPALAQESTTVSIFGVQIEVTTVDALVALLGGGLVTLIVQFLKTKIKVIATGVGAFVFTVFVTFAATAIYFLVIHPMVPWVWLQYIVYAGAVLGESTGWFHLYKKVTGTPTT